MPPHVSKPADLVLHGPRVLGFASGADIATRFALDPTVVEELLLDFEAYGWVHQSSFAGRSGWSITDRGRAENERRLGVELDELGVRPLVAALHRDFLRSNRRFLKACTDWQIRPTRDDSMAANDHTDWGWDEQVLKSLATIGRSLRTIDDGLSALLARFDGYAIRYADALRRVDGGERQWVESPEADSCHTVWIQLHEDLLATLGVPRGEDDDARFRSS
jgi:hypothetical protein